MNIGNAGTNLRSAHYFREKAALSFILVLVVAVRCGQTVGTQEFDVALSLRAWTWPN